MSIFSRKSTSEYELNTLTPDQQNTLFLNMAEDGEINIQPLPYRAEISDDDLYHRMETNHCVKQAPRLIEQLSDRSRKNIVASVMGNVALLTSDVDGVSRTRESYVLEETEQQTISGLYGDLNALIAAQRGESGARYAASLREDMTFIGQKEFVEATKGIAAYWRERLSRNPQKKLFILLGEVSRLDDVAYKAPKDKVKSDEYVMDAVINNFSREDLQQFSQRILIDEKELENESDVGVIMLDDWTISGTEMTEQRNSFVQRHPELASHMELQLIVSDFRRIAAGFQPLGKDDDEPWLPVRSYYVANDVPLSVQGAYITGSHSSDYTLAGNVVSLCSDGDALPQGLQVKRPYHHEQYKTTFREKLRS